MIMSFINIDNIKSASVVISDPHSLLAGNQKSVLIDSLECHFTLGKYDSLYDIVDFLGIAIVVEPGIQCRKIPVHLEDAERFWQEKTNSAECGLSENGDRSEYEKAREKLRRVQREIEHWSNMTLRGMYIPEKKCIKLFPEAMIQEYGGCRMNELLLSTLAHEIMHAYFDRPGHENHPYIISVEEPLAEFGMLMYLKESGVATDDFYNWAYNDVASKKTCYKYGAMLMKQYMQGDEYLRDYLEDYYIALY